MDTSHTLHVVIMGVLLVLVLGICTYALYKGGMKGWWWPAAGVILMPVLFAVARTLA